MEQQQETEGLVGSLTTSLSPKGCSIAAIANNDCGLICGLIGPEPCVESAGGCKTGEIEMKIQRVLRIVRLEGK